MKANKIRFIAGGLAAVMLMSNITATAVFAEEAEVQAAVEETAAPAVEEAPELPAAVETEAPAVEEAPDLPAAVETKAPAVEEAPDLPAAVETEAPAVEEAAPEVEEAAPAVEAVEEAAPAVEAVEEAAAPELEEEVGTAKAGNIEEEAPAAEETTVAEETANSATESEDQLTEAFEDNANGAAAEAQADRIVQENKERVAKLEERFSKMTAAELLDYWKKVNKVNTALENGTYVAPEEDAEVTEEDDIAAAIREFGMEIIKEAMSNGIDEAVDLVPGAKYVGGPFKTLFKKALGLEGDDEKVSVDETVREEADRIIAQLEQMQKDNKKDNINANTVSSYNETLNDLDEFVDSRMEEIENTNNNSEYNEIDKLVRNA
ncbi:MAG: hypothetical protein J6X94_09295, partial [Lachnospiraceae bacterium]|nr:hypothetical protein [Lachnospiraceae bacterium]